MNSRLNSFHMQSSVALAEEFGLGFVYFGSDQLFLKLCSYTCRITWSFLVFRALTSTILGILPLVKDGFVLESFRFRTYGRFTCLIPDLWRGGSRAESY